MTKRSRAHRSLVVLAVVGALVMTACGDDDAVSDGTAAGGASAAATTADEAADTAPAT